MQLSNAGTHLHSYLQYLVAWPLRSCGNMGQAVKIALEVKKYLVDNDFMDISQVRCTVMPLVPQETFLNAACLLRSA